MQAQTPAACGRSKTGTSAHRENEVLETGAHVEDAQSASGEHTLGPWVRYNEAAVGFRNYWYPVMLSRSLGRKPVPMTLLGEQIVFFRNGKRVSALNNRCPHRGIP